MSAKITAPWTPEQVEALNAYQADGPMHPFTCPHRDKGHVPRESDRDLAVLTATEQGWVCDACGYTQQWAWPWMSDTSWWKDEPGASFVPGDYPSKPVE